MRLKFSIWRLETLKLEVRKLAGIYKTVWNIDLSNSTCQGVTLKVGTQQTASCSNISQRQITRSVQVGGLEAATCPGDISQWQITSCVLENFCPNLSLHNTILSMQHVVQIQQLVATTKFFCGDKTFKEILQYTQSDL